MQKVEVLDFEIVPHHIDGHLIAQRKSDGYVNATAMCKAAGKEWSNYKQNADTRAVVASLSRSLQIRRDLLILTITTGKNAERGTWVHPKVALHLATWCSPDFYAQVISWVYDEVTTQAPVFKLPQTFAESLRLLADATEANDRLLLKNTELLTHNEELAAVTEELKDEVQFAPPSTAGGGSKLLKIQPLIQTPLLPTSSSTRVIRLAPAAVCQHLHPGLSLAATSGRFLHHIPMNTILLPTNIPAQLVPSLSAHRRCKLLMLSNIFMTFAWYGHLKYGSVVVQPLSWSRMQTVG